MPVKRSAERLVFRPSPTWMALISVGSLLFVLLGTSRIHIDHSMALAMDRLTIVFFGLGVIAGPLVALLNHRLEVDEGGFCMRHAFASYCWAWTDIEEFKLVQVTRLQKVVAFTCVPEYKRFRKLRSLGKITMFGVSGGPGVDGLVPNIYRIDGEKLLGILRQFHARAMARQERDPVACGGSER